MQEWKWLQPRSLRQNDSRQLQAETLITCADVRSPIMSLPQTQKAGTARCFAPGGQFQPFLVPPPPPQKPASVQNEFVTFSIVAVYSA